ncbi:polynucleotide kinase [Phaeobacter sp. C3_T13_0]|uniref:phosphatase domain-containing protein n=1 Tax=Phaeobacter cretensis TaxID=3342641 RepID=UPI0039BD2DA5
MMLNNTAVQGSGKPCVVFDVDGTLAHFDAKELGHLVHGEVKDWNGFHIAMADAAPIEPVARLLRQLKAAGEKIVICSGRPAGWVDHTTAWLRKNDLPFDGVYLRPEDLDAESDPDIKRLLLAEMRADKWDPWIIIDDRSSVVEAWRDAGLVCLQCAPGNF